MRFTGIAVLAAIVGSAFAKPSKKHHRGRKHHFEFEPVKAVAHFTNAAQNVTATVTFTQNSIHEGTQVFANITGLVDGTKHGLHIHQFGDLSNGCASFGGHYNPYNQTHGSAFSEVRHVGDFGNIESVNGQAILNYTLPSVQLFGPHSVIGRGIVLHAGEDDLGLGGSPLSNTTGNAGDRLACGVIGLY